MTKEEYLQKGRSLLEEKEWEAAQEALEAALELDEEYAEAWHELGHIFLQNGELAQAQEYYEYAAQNKDALRVPWTALGHAAAQQEEGKDLALQYYKTAVQADPQNSDPWNGLGILYASKIGKPPEAARCFLRAEYLGKERHAANTFIIFAQLPPQPFFSYRLIRDYMPATVYPEWKNYVLGTVEEAGPLQAYLQWMQIRQTKGENLPPEWQKWLGLIHYHMGDPATALTYLDQAQEKNEKPDLMIAYYQLQATWDFLESDAPYLEVALAEAEKYAHEPKKGWAPWAKKQAAPPLSEQEIIPCYYAGLIFIENDELKKAMSCFERIENDFLPAAYMAYWLTEEMVQPKNKTQKAAVLLEREATKKQFTEGLSTSPLDADPEKFLQQLSAVNRYLELADAIDVLHYQADFEGNPYDYEIAMSKDQAPFYMLWKLAGDERETAISEIRKAFFQEIETALASSLEALASSTDNQSIEERIANALQNRQIDREAAPLLAAYFHQKDRLDTRAKHFLDLYPAILPQEEETEVEKEVASPLPGRELAFLLHFLTEPESQLAGGELANAFVEFREEQKKSEATLSYPTFREQLTAFAEKQKQAAEEEE